MPAVLVTGAYGLLASHVIQQLVAEGHEVRGSVRNAKDEVKLKHLQALCPEDSPGKLEVVEADLLKEDSWLPAVEGMDYVIHTACPWPVAPPEKDDDQLKPAVEGTLNVLNACAKVLSVKRVIYTSSTIAVQFSPSPGKKIYTEADWNDSKTLDSLGKSKLLAEKAAWEFINNLPADRKLELAVLNPGTLLGPLLNHSESCSVGLIRKFLEHLIPAVPKICFAVADVRDVAKAHVKTMTLPEAAGHRHILSSGNLWLSEIGTLLNAVFGPLGNFPQVQSIQLFAKGYSYKIPTMPCPNMILRMASALDRSTRVIIPYLGVVHNYDTTRMTTVLGIEPTNMRDSVIDMAHSLVQMSIAPTTDKYSPARDPAEREKYLTMKL